MVGRALASLGLFTALALAQAPVARAGARLVRDIDTTHQPTVVFGFFGEPYFFYGSLPEQLTAVDGRLFFAANDRVAGLELWQSQGSEGSTRLVADVCPGRCDARPRILGESGGFLYFFADDGTHGFELWRTNGAAGGTKRVADLCPGPCGQVEFLPPTRLAAPLAGGLYFPARTAVGADQSLWRTDGTSEGTVPVFERPPAGGRALSIDRLTVEAGQLLFVVNLGSQEELWASDGRPGGARRVWQACGGGSGTIAGIAVARGAWYFAEHCQAGGSALYRVSGEDAPQQLFQVASEGLAPVTLALSGDRLFFTVYPPHLGLAELWVSDGTPGSERMLLRLGFIEWLTPAGNKLAFAGTELGVTRLYECDGTTTGTRAVSDLPLVWSRNVPGAFTPSPLAFVDGKVLFPGCGSADDCEPWSYDPTTRETRLLADIAPGPVPSLPAQYVAVGEQVFFTATHPETDQELWALDRHDLDPRRCQPSAERLCLGDGRFSAEVRFLGPAGEASGQAVPLSGEAGAFWFFDRELPELTVKILDGRDLNGAFWVLWGSLSDRAYTLEVTDLSTGARKRFTNPAGNLCGGADVSAFPAAGRSQSRAEFPPERSLSGRGSSLGCAPSSERLCLGENGTIAVSVTWRVPGSGLAGTGTVFEAGERGGFFSFFAPGNLELAVKLVDGRGLNGKLWFFWAALSDVDYTLTLVNTETGEERHYTNPAGQLCGGADVQALTP